MVAMKSLGLLRRANAQFQVVQNREGLVVSLAPAELNSVAVLLEIVLCPFVEKTAWLVWSAERLWAGHLSD